MILKIRIYLFFLLAIVSFACTKKDNNITTTALAEFAYDGTGAIPTPAAGAPAIGSYFITNNSNSVYKIPIGITTVSNVDRTINYTVTSSTGATAGQQYTLASNSIVIPAGKVVDSIAVKGLFAGYPSGRKDTLTFTITGGDVNPFPGYNVFKLVMQKYCDVVGSDLVGAYTKSTDTYNGAASTKPNYTATISNFKPVTATTATITIQNLGATSDNGWGPFKTTDPVITPGLTATLDWSNPANFSVTIPTQNYFNDGSGMSTITATGTFSSCDQTFTITCKVKYAGNGSTYTHVSYLRR